MKVADPSLQGSAWERTALEALPHFSRHAPQGPSHTRLQICPWFRAQESSQ